MCLGKHIKTRLTALNTPRAVNINECLLVQLENAMSKRTPKVYLVLSALPETSTPSTFPQTTLLFIKQQDLGFIMSQPNPSAAPTSRPPSHDLQLSVIPIPPDPKFPLRTSKMSCENSSTNEQVRHFTSILLAKPGSSSLTLPPWTPTFSPLPHGIRARKMEKLIS